MPPTHLRHLHALGAIVVGVRIVTALTSGAAASQDPPRSEKWLAAERRIVRLEPSAFRELPPAVVALLEARGCRIPQTTFASRPENVISGHFFDDPRPLDWAALCSRNGRSVVLVIPGEAGSDLLPPNGRSIAELDEQPDARFLQVVAPGRIGFSRSISTATRTAIAQYAQRIDAPLPPLMHDGIEDAFAEKGSVIWYRYAGQWLKLPGSD